MCANLKNKKVDESNSRKQPDLMILSNWLLHHGSMTLWYCYHSKPNQIKHEIIQVLIIKKQVSTGVLFSYLLVILFFNFFLPLISFEEWHMACHTYNSVCLWAAVFLVVTIANYLQQKKKDNYWITIPWMFESSSSWTKSRKESSGRYLQYGW